MCVRKRRSRPGGEYFGGRVTAIKTASFFFYRRRRCVDRGSYKKLYLNKISQTRVGDRPGGLRQPRTDHPRHRGRRRNRRPQHGGHNCTVLWRSGRRMLRPSYRIIAAGEILIPGCARVSLSAITSAGVTVRLYRRSTVPTVCGAEDLRCQCGAVCGVQGLQGAGTRLRSRGNE